MKKNKKEKFIALRVTEQEYEYYNKLAAQRNLTVSTIIRLALEQYKEGD